MLAKPYGSDGSSSKPKPSPPTAPLPSSTSWPSFEYYKGDLAKCEDDTRSEAEADAYGGVVVGIDLQIFCL
jgi:hypothetical protein